MCHFPCQCHLTSSKKKNFILYEEDFNDLIQLEDEGLEINQKSYSVNHNGYCFDQILLIVFKVE